MQQCFLKILGAAVALLHHAAVGGTCVQLCGRDVRAEFRKPVMDGPCIVVGMDGEAF
jgi:hypothetical protein